MTGSFRRYLVCGAVACVAGCGFLAQPSVAADGDVSRAMAASVVPDADLFLNLDMASFLESDIQKKAAALSDKTERLLPENTSIDEVRGKAEALWKALGITLEDVDRVALSMKTGGTGAVPQVALRSMNGLVAVSVTRTLTCDAVLAGLQQNIEAFGVNNDFRRETYRGRDVLRGSTGRTDAAGNPIDGCLALTAEGRVIYLGNWDSVRCALDRCIDGQSGKAAAELEVARSLIPAEAQMSLLFVPGDQFRSAVRQQAARTQAGNPMMANAMAAVGGMKHLRLSLASDTTMDLTLALRFTTADEALQVKTMLDMMVLGMGKMTLMQMVGKPIPMIDSLKSEQQNTDALISMRVTMEDLDALSQLRTQRAAEMAFPGEGGNAPPVQQDAPPAE